MGVRFHPLLRRADRNALERLSPLWVKGKIAEYDLDEDEFSFALRRARYTVETHGPVYVEDTTGHRERMRLYDHSLVWTCPDCGEVHEEEPDGPDPDKKGPEA